MTAMGVASSNRGTRIIARATDALMTSAHMRADRQAYADDAARLRAEVAHLERQLARARRCLAAERMGREALRVALINERSAYSFAIGILTKLAFPEDKE